MEFEPQSIPSSEEAGGGKGSAAQTANQAKGLPQNAHLLVGARCADAFANDIEQLEAFNSLNEELQKVHWRYVGTRAQLRDLMNDFCSSVLLNKPDDIYAYAKDYFSSFCP